MMKGTQVTANIIAGDEITDLRDLMKIWKEGKSVAVFNQYRFWYVRSAGFMAMWPLAQLANMRFFHTVKVDKPKVTKERKHGYAKKLQPCKHEFVPAETGNICAKCGAFQII
jgi:hypothetical protein